MIQKNFDKSLDSDLWGLLSGPKYFIKWINVLTLAFENCCLYINTFIKKKDFIIKHKMLKC